MDLNSINGIDSSALELLEAAGVNDLQALAASDPAALAAELARANKLLRLAPENLALESISDWVGQASLMLAPPAAVDAEGANADEPVPVDYEQSPEVMAMLASAPLALPLPAKVLMENRVSVSQIPAGILLNCVYGDLDVRVNQSPLPAMTPGEAYATPYAGLAPTAQSRQSSGAAMDLLRTPRAATNKGIDPNSRWYIRGVLHSDPVTLYFAALVTFFTFLVVPSSIISAVLLVLSSELPESFTWVPSWLLAIPASLLILGPAYLIWGLGGRCRICNQRLFVHRTHLKNSKAHHVPGLGYVLPLCFHILVFKWFRCTHCGTAIRVKE